MIYRCDREAGFTLIEIVIFILITGILMTTILLSSGTALRSSPAVHQQWVAMNAASRCMEWFLDQRRINGYSSITCPSNPSPAACTAPSGFTVSTSVICSTWNTDANYKQVTVSVSGLASASISMQIGDYQ